MQTTAAGASDELLDREQARLILGGVSGFTIDRLRRDREIESVKVRGQFFYRRAALAAYLARNTTPAKTSGRSQRSQARDSAA